MTTRKALLDKYGSPEAVSAEMRRRQELSMLNPKKQKGNFKGGFAAMPIDDVKELSRRGVEARKNRKLENED